MSVRRKKQALLLPVPFLPESEPGIEDKPTLEPQVKRLLCRAREPPLELATSLWRSDATADSPTHRRGR